MATVIFIKVDVLLNPDVNVGCHGDIGHNKLYFIMKI